MKTLGYYGSAPVGLIEDSEVKGDENGVEVMEMDFGGEDDGDEMKDVGGDGGVKDGESDGAGKEVGVEREGVHPK